MAEPDRSTRQPASDQTSTGDRTNDSSRDRPTGGNLGAHGDASDRGGAGGYGAAEGTHSGSDARGEDSPDDMTDQSDVGMRGRDTGRSSDGGLL